MTILPLVSYKHHYIDDNRNNVKGSSLLMNILLYLVTSIITLMTTVIMPYQYKISVPQLSSGIAGGTPGVILQRVPPPKQPNLMPCCIP